MAVARAFAHVFLLTVGGAILCSLTFAGDEKPETGTIEVEVVYKDTGEPVEGVLVTLTRGEAYLDWGVCQDGRLLIELAAPDKETSYTVTLWHHPPFGRLPAAMSSTFLWQVASCQRDVTLSAEARVAKAVFEVDRGWRLLGTVKLDDGSPLAGGAVVLEQGGAPEENAFGLTDDTGSFDMFGVAPGDTTRLTVFSVLDASPGVMGYIPLSSEIISLTGDSTLVDLEVHTIALTLVVDVAKPVWPFPSAERYSSRRARIWVGGEPATTDEGGCVRIMLDVLEPDRAPGLPKDRYEVELPHFPPNETMTIVVETREYASAPVPSRRRVDSGEFIVSAVPDDWQVVARTKRTVELGNKDRGLTLVHYDPVARLSRAFWYAVPSVIVLAVCVTVLVREARRRRHAQSSTFRQDKLD